MSMKNIAKVFAKVALVAFPSVIGYSQEIEQDTAALSAKNELSVDTLNNEQTIEIVESLDDFLCRYLKTSQGDYSIEESGFNPEKAREDYHKYVSSLVSFYQDNATDLCNKDSTGNAYLMNYAVAALTRGDIYELAILNSVLGGGWRSTTSS